MMTHANNLTIQPINRAALIKRMLIGGGIAFVLIALLVLPIRNPKPEWGELWMIRPFIITPLAGAAGGAFNYLMNNTFALTGWKKVLALVISILGFVIAIWLGIVLGLAGTLWN
ncbi:potassium transporter KefB [Mucilaginibacter mali]|uniref:Potassium transporter KefB n=1 Tax=Mucilaginibacter mali TaxID=2740462 RepID=A0A7D4UKE0_9SPHI|nr:potassium transporter KefB [Mucilaginibacter mali]QKJ30502.1 potassium transporter KefB [Mucilaginibacter mali]